MRTKLLLPALAALAGCYVDHHDRCLGTASVYWTPSVTPPQAGFQVPGLVAAGFPAQLDCAQAGVSAVEVSVDGRVLPCATAGSCRGSDWLCTTGGVSVDLEAGPHRVRLDALDAFGNLKYQADDRVDVFCGQSASSGHFPQGVAGPLGIDYAFTPAANCQAGSVITWDLRSGTSAPYDTGSIACGTTNPFDVAGGAAIPAGVYTLVRVAEVAASTSYHAACSATPFVHAGPEDLAVDMPVSNQTCF